MTVRQPLSQRVRSRSQRGVTGVSGTGEREFVIDERVADRNRQREEESGASSDLGLDPDAAAVLLDRQLAEGQPHAAVVTVMNRMPGLFESVEDAFLVSFGDAFPVIPHRKYPEVVLTPGTEVDVTVLAGMFHCVGEEVRQYPPQQRRVSMDALGFRLDQETEVAFAGSNAHVPKCLLRQG